MLSNFSSIIQSARARESPAPFARKKTVGPFMASPPKQMSIRDKINEMVKQTSFRDRVIVNHDHKDMLKGLIKPALRKPTDDKLEGSEFVKNSGFGKHDLDRDGEGSIRTIKSVMYSFGNESARNSELKITENDRLMNAGSSFN